MIVITFSNPKGGTGKTTANLILAEQIAKRGGRVTILDMDPNKNIIGWAEDRAEKGMDVPFRIIPRVENADDFYDQLEAEDEHGDYMLIDLEGTADQLTTFATGAADLVLIPMTLTFMEAKQGTRAARLVASMAKHARRTIPTKLLLTRTSSAIQGKDEKDMRDMLAEGGADILPVELMNRTAYNSMFKRGMTLQELYDATAAGLEGKSDNARDRQLRPIRSAMENADAYGSAVLEAVERVVDAK